MYDVIFYVAHFWESLTPTYYILRTSGVNDFWQVGEK